MLFSLEDIMEYVEENDVKFIRLVFFDIFGSMKNISIIASELPQALEYGVTFDASEIKGFMNIGESDLLLKPDPTTAEILPWRPQHSRVLRIFCDICYPDGRPFEGDSRYILKSVVGKLADMGYTCDIGAESTFYLFELDEYGLPTKKPHDFGAYYDVAPADRGENIRREICLTLEEMGIQPESSHHDEGPGQHEIIFRHSTPIEAADHLMTFKNMVKTIADMNGLYASFIPKPLSNQSGNGFHVNVCLYNDSADGSGTSLLNGEDKVGRSFIAGVLKRVNDMGLFLNPTTNSYGRFGQFEAPLYVTWSFQNRQQLIRIPKNLRGEGRMELRSPDGSANPYLVYALVLSAGMEGIRDGLELCDPINVTYKSDIDGLVRLPENLEAAVNYAKHSSFLRDVLPENILNTYIDQKKEEYDGYVKAKNKEEYETELYFGSM
ncbi:MAG: glutamine synthetase family protein [Clostridiales bacterium]|nr:glutamine synthetase family protein [Clostridiales bacterium]